MKWCYNEIETASVRTVISFLGLFLAFTSFGQHDSIDRKLFDSFGMDFVWGAACAAYQVEGAWNEGGRGPSIWDQYSQRKGNIYHNENGNIATDFYHRFEEDIHLLDSMGFKAFRFSISWSRIFPDESGQVNPEGVAFYHKVIDACIKRGVEPWVTLYHWDLPLYLQERGGWSNRETISNFSNYVSFCAKEFGSKVQHWMVMNEPAAFVGLGYLVGMHAPGHINIRKFLKATHHVCLAMAEGGRSIRNADSDAQIGTTFSCSVVDPILVKPRHEKAKKRMDAMLNRLWIEPSLGMGYPSEDLPILKKLKKFHQPGDSSMLSFDFDFIGLQHYFRVIVRANPFIPVVGATRIEPARLHLPVNEMGFEINPEGMLRTLRNYKQYPVKHYVITENGVCTNDILTLGEIEDTARIDFFRGYLTSVSEARKEGIPIDGYFVWSLTDNFEWSEGYRPRFGLVYVDYANQQRTVKASGHWFRKYIQK
jgi:beta-glucosidase